jgi:hypothetical protein
MIHHREEYQQAPLRNDGAPRVHQGEVYNQPGQHPQEVGRQPGQVYESTNNAAMPPYNFAGNAGRDQLQAQNTQVGYGTSNAVGNDRDSYGTAAGARHQPFTGTHHGQQDEAIQAGATTTGLESTYPTKSYVDPSAHRAAVPPPVGSNTAGATRTAGAAQGTAGAGMAEPTTGEKIRGTLRQAVGELQGNSRKAAEGKALREGTHPVQTGPYSAGRHI